MARTTKLQVQRAFERLIAHIGGTVYDGVFADRVGKFALDYAPQFGGYRVIRFSRTGESSPFGEQRQSAGEFWQSVYMVTHAAEVAERLKAEVANG